MAGPGGVMVYATLYCCYHSIVSSLVVACLYPKVVTGLKAEYLSRSLDCRGRQEMAKLPDFGSFSFLNTVGLDAFLVCNHLQVIQQ